MKEKIKYPRECAFGKCKRKVYKSEHSDKCSRHRNRAWRDEHPLAYFFHKLRSRANERGITFTLTFEQYERFAITTDYAKMKGKTSLSLTIDRKDNGLGYHEWNIQAMLLRENSRKSHVAFFAGQKLPPDEQEEYLRFEIDYHLKCEKIAAEVGKIHKPGSIVFWKEYRARKDQLFSVVEETA
jgi:hypothetical protein